MRKMIPAILVFLTAASGFADVSFGSVEYYKSTTYNSQTGFDIAQYVTVNHSGDAEEFFITFSGGGQNDTSNRAMSSWDGWSATYQLYDNPTDRRILRILSDLPSSNEVLGGSFSSGSGSQTLEYYYSMADGSFPYGTSYSDTITIRLYSGTLSSYTLAASVNVQVAVTVNGQMDVSVVAAGGTFDESSTSKTLDFGVITSGAEREADIIVRANTQYNLSLTSANGGVLKRTDQWEESEIPYTLYVDDSAVSLPSWQAVEVAGSSNPTNPDGTSHNVRVVIDSFWGVTTGTFGDTIQITLAAW